MTRSNKTLTNFILQSMQNPTTFVGHLTFIMQNKQQTNQQFNARFNTCCCIICCMP
jgi:hypothetical protein